MNLNRITDNCVIARKNNAVVVSMPRIGSHHFQDSDALIEVFLDEHRPKIHVVYQSRDREELIIATHLTCGGENAGDYRLSGLQYRMALSGFEQSEGLTLERQQTMIWLLEQITEMGRVLLPEHEMAELRAAS